jgi:hypothetical protein
LDPLTIASHLFDRMSPCSTVKVNLPTWKSEKTLNHILFNKTIIQFYQM